MAPWLGVDVGGKRKAFDAALVDDRRLIAWRGRQSADEVVAWVESAQPTVVAIDSPRSCAPPGHTHRPEEKQLRDAVCGIRWTPPDAQLHGNTSKVAFNALATSSCRERLEATRRITPPAA
jgi:predicted nuclease with RNAse H fold